MKLVVRVFALSVVVAGAAAAAISPSAKPAIPSHQSATAANPIPQCVPGLPTCPTR